MSMSPHPRSQEVDMLHEVACPRRAQEALIPSYTFQCGEQVLYWGVIGLLDVIETFDSARRTKFESYAISKIR